MYTTAFCPSNAGDIVTSFMTRLIPSHLQGYNGPGKSGTPKASSWTARAQAFNLEGLCEGLDIEFDQQDRKSQSLQVQSPSNLPYQKSFGKTRRTRGNGALPDNGPGRSSLSGDDQRASDDGSVPAARDPDNGGTNKAGSHFRLDQGLDAYNTPKRPVEGVAAELSKLRETNQTLEDHVDWMQWQVDHAHWIGGFHIEDTKIEQEFITLMERITTWSRNADFTAKDGIALQLQFPKDDDQRHLLCQVSPWCSSQDEFEKNINKNPRQQRYLLRGLVARVLCDKVFPPNGEDCWLDKETRSQLKGLERKVSPKGQFIPWELADLSPFT